MGTGGATEARLNLWGPGHLEQSHLPHTHLHARSEILVLVLPHLNPLGPKWLTSEQHLVLEEALDYTQHTMLHVLATPLRTLLLGEGRRDAVRDLTTHRPPFFLLSDQLQYPTLSDPGCLPPGSPRIIPPGSWSGSVTHFSEVLLCPTTGKGPFCPPRS